MNFSFKSWAVPFAFFLGLSAQAVRAEDAAVDSTDKAFLQGAYADGLAEVQVAQLGQKKTGNPDVKALADHIVTDHTQANVDLKALADSKRVTLAQSLGLVDQAKSKMLDAKTGDSFDKSFVDGLVSDHKKDLESFQKAAAESKDPDVKAYAAKIVPTLQMHLSMAEQVQAKIGK